MDALSKIFEDIHLNQSEYLYLKPYGEWAFRYSEQSTMMAYAVLQGPLYTTNFIGPLSYQAFSFLKLRALS